MNTVYLLQVSATHVAIYSEVRCTGRMYRDITTACEARHRCKVLSFKNTPFKIQY